ncbi:WxcM-like protein [Algoriphagus boseongensis]|uniref:WxcM-like protein n=1 Tax=Algoriphagus boseongensis TaxID=1442587 RepID=A0A4R6T5B8_9BACT|nr:FdtA/QdtA family cupin domain-containing protein [Algoriphagus boseongensis]TDQ16479.1 WxcM-like protein [Algoriphagus boseongensis]
MIIPDLKRLKQAYQRAELISVPKIGNELGQLSYWENMDLFPNGILRSFWITGVRKEEIRGKHAHYKENQVIFALNGKLWIRVEGLDSSISEFTLSSPEQGLYIPPMNWVEIQFESEACLLGLSDRAFSENDYIRDKNKFGSLQTSEI